MTAASFKVTDKIDYGTRRKLRMKLGSRVGRRAGTKAVRARSGRSVVKPQTRPAVRLRAAIREYLAS